MKTCEKCGGTGKVPKPVSHGVMGEEDCPVCEGTGQMEDIDNEDMVRLLGRMDKRLKRIVELMERE